MDSWLCSTCNHKLSAAREEEAYAPVLLMFLHNGYKVPWPKVAELDYYNKECCLKMLQENIDFIS